MTFRNESLITFLKKKVKTILIPYIAFSIIGIIIYDVLSVILPSFGDKFNIFEQLFIMLYGNSRPHIMIWNTPLWFLPALFAVSVIVYFINYFISNKINEKNQAILEFVLCFFLLVFGVVFQTFFNVRLPFHLESSSFLAGFMMLGMIIMKSNVCQKLEKIDSNYLMIIAISFVLFGCLISYLNGFAEIRIYEYGKNGFLFVLSSILLSISIILLSMIIKDNKAIEKIGRDSLSILLMHKYPILVFELCFKVLNISVNDTSILYLCIAIIISIICIIACEVASKVIVIVFPQLIGAKK